MKNLLLFTLCVLVVQIGLSQEIIESYRDQLSKYQIEKLSMDQMRSSPTLIQLGIDEVISSAGAKTLLEELLIHSIEDKSTFQELNSQPLTEGIIIRKYQQYIRGIPVEHGIYKGVEKNGVIGSFAGEFYPIQSNKVALRYSSTISEDQAIQAAKNKIGAKKYAWEIIQEIIDDNADRMTLKELGEFNKSLEEYTPKGELVFVDDYRTKEVDLKLAYKFNVYADQPLYRAWVYVDAINGDILLEDAIIKHVNGTGDTRYSGTRDFQTTLVDGSYVLNGTTVTGVDNETRSMEGVGGLPLSLPALYGLSVEIMDDDNNWTVAEHRPDDFSVFPYGPVPTTPATNNDANNDDVALDAHWGAEQVLDYWKLKHNRLSYDNQSSKMFNFVHYGDGYDNAFWNGEAMTYGDGSYQGGGASSPGMGGGFKPLTALDVCGHEVGHGVTEFTSDLVYARESGAMNEGLSDVWGAAVENYVLTEVDETLDYIPFGIGEQIDGRDNGAEPPSDPLVEALRWMDDPKAAGDPDSYGGTNWQNPDCGEPTLANDQCGVHTNSGVLNKWFYLLAVGSGQAIAPGSGKALVDDEINDDLEVYSVSAIGFSKAEQIAFLGQSMLSPNATFADMRNTSILAAQILYGVCSFEEEQTVEAWYGVNVGPAWEDCDSEIDFAPGNPVTASEKSSSLDCGGETIYTISIFSSALPAMETITLATNTSTATYEDDFILSTNSLTFTGSELKTVDLIVKDDAIIEGSENVIITFLYGGETKALIVEIIDDDNLPIIGDGDIVLLDENFDTGTSAPSGWTIVSELAGNNSWQFNGTGTDAIGKAYIDNNLVAYTGTPTYDSNSSSKDLLVSPIMNAIGLKQVTVSFDWQAGGETDGAGPIDGTIYDYGEFLYKKVGEPYVALKQFVGLAIQNTTPEEGTYSAVINPLDNSMFQLAWRWFNDTNAGGPFSFTIDNIKVLTPRVDVETTLNNSSQNDVDISNEVYFLSDQDGDIMIKIENATEDLGCVSVEVVEAGTSEVSFSNIDGTRAEKVFRISADGVDAATANYDITLYFTGEELQEFTDLSMLKVIKVDDDDIDNAVLGNFTLDGSVDESTAAENYYTATGNFTGFSTFSVATDQRADLTPTISSVGTLNENSSVDVRIRIFNIGGLATNGEINFFVTKLEPTFSIAFDPVAVSNSIGTLNNSDWSVTDMGGALKFTWNNPGGLSGMAVSDVGLTVQASGVSESSGTLTASIEADTGGGESSTGNNSRTFNYVIN